MNALVDAVAVIGAGYGDEGKGLVTDALSSPSTRVVRFNGGAQAGHTVCTPDGERHVFHHVGSGTFAGATTHLSRYFVVNPILAIPEIEQLGIPKEAITVSPRAMVTTPFEMMTNQAVELKRGAKRHGSCGIGFGETFERASCNLGLYVSDIMDSSRLECTMQEIKEWTFARWRLLGFKQPDMPYDDAVIETFLEDWRRFMDLVTLREDALVAKDVDRVVFEGAQGLGLDQTLGHFPHVTRSFTGLPNVVSLCNEAGIAHVRAIYVTRSYTTRHGAGPLELEGAFNIGWPLCETNSDNKWQGSLRYAVLDRGLLRRRIKADLSTVETWKVSVAPGLFMTCMDQAATYLQPLVTEYGFAAIDTWPSHTASLCGVGLVGTSHGNTRLHTRGLRDD